MIMPMYVCEASPAHIRGQMVTYINVAITGGQFVSACIDGALSGVSDGWKIMLGLAAAPAAIQLIGFYFMPESPRWLIEQGRIAEATKILRTLRGRYDVREEVQDILNTIRAERPDEFPANFNFENFMSDMSMTSPVADQKKESLLFGNVSSSWKPPSPAKKITLWERLTKRAVLRALVVGCALQAAQQFGGINTVMYYSASILKIAGFNSNSEAIWLSVLVSFFNFAGSLVGLMIVDRYGRRWLTLTSLGFVSIFLVAIGAAFYVTEHYSSNIDLRIGGEQCSEYNYCFDCTQDENCGYCSDALMYAAGSTVPQSLGSVCLPRDDGQDYWKNVTSAGNTYSCAAKGDYYTEVCDGSRAYGYLILTCLCLYLAAFSPGMGPMPWTINSEIYPTSVRGVANSITTSVNWGSNLIMSMSFLSVIKALTRQGAFWMYSGVAFAFFIFLYFYLPETLGIPLENVEELFNETYWGRAQHSRTHLLSEEEPLSDRDYNEGGNDHDGPQHENKSDTNEQSFYRKLMPSSKIATADWKTRQLLEDAETSGTLNKAYDQDDSAMDINAVYSTLMRTSTNTDFDSSGGNNNSRSHKSNGKSSTGGSRGKSSLNSSMLDSFNSRNFNFARFTRDSHVNEGESSPEPRTSSPTKSRASDTMADNGPDSGNRDDSKDDMLSRRHSYDSFVSNDRKDKIRKNLINTVLNSATSIQPVEEGSDHSRDSLISV
jgi:SP family myo-inositol transporter-like MFS transporter 13